MVTNPIFIVNFCAIDGLAANANVAPAAAMIAVHRILVPRVIGASRGLIAKPTSNSSAARPLRHVAPDAQILASARASLNGFLFPPPLIEFNVRFPPDYVL